MRPPYALTLALSLLQFASPSAAAGGPEPPAKNPAAEATNPAKPDKSARENRRRARSKDSRAKRRQRAKAKDRSAAKRPLSPADYGRWESIDLGNRRFSNDGKWLVYSISRVDEQRTLHLHRVKGTKTPEETTFKQGERPMFSNDSKWLAVTIGKTPAELKKSKTAESKPPPSAGSTVHLRRLDDGRTTEFEHVQSLSFSEDSAFVAFEVMGKPAKPGPAKPPSSGKKSGPSKALLVRTLANGNDTTFGNVVKFAWSDQGALLAMVIDSPSISNSLQLYNPATGVLRTLESSDQEYGTLQWRKDSYDLGVLREMPHEEKEDISHVLLAWRGLDQDEPEHFKVDHAKLKAFPKEMYIAPGLEWSKDGETLFCNLKKWEKKPKELPGTVKNKANKRKNKKKRRGENKNRETRLPEKKEAESGEPNDEKERAGDTKKKDGEPSTPPSKTLRESLETPSNVEVWHSKDVEIMPRQKKQASSKKNPNRRAAWWLQRGKVVQLATDLTENVTILGTGRQALGQDRTPHERTAMFGPHLQDLYLINTANGKRERVLEGVKFTLSHSPDGHYFLFVRDGQVWSHHVKSGQVRNLTGKLETHFTNQEDDTLAVEKHPYGSGVWLKDSSAVLLYDRFDIWLIAPDGSRTVNLTDGSKDKIRHRISQASFREDDDGHLDPAEPLYVALYGDRTKKSGYGRLSFQPQVSTLKTLLWDDRMMLFLSRAKEAEVFSLTMERYHLPRDLYVGWPEARQTRSGDRHQCLSKGISVGPHGVNRLPEQTRRQAPGIPHLSRGLPKGEKVSHDRLHLRETLARVAPLHHTEREASLQCGRLLGRRLLCLSTRYRLPAPGARCLGGGVRRPSGGESAGERNGGSREDRPDGPLVGRLPDFVHRHANRPLRRRRSGSPFDRPLEHVRERLLEHRGHQRLDLRPVPGPHEPTLLA